MSKLILNFFGEKVSINFPDSLSSLRQNISEKFFFSLDEVSEFLLTYTKDKNTITISTENDFELFSKEKINEIKLDLNENSQLFQNNLSKLQNENEITKKNLEEILKQIEEINIKKKEKKEKIKLELDEITKKNEELKIKKKEIIEQINKDIKNNIEAINSIKLNAKKEIHSLDKELLKLVKTANTYRIKLGIEPEEIKKEKQPSKKPNIKKGEISEEIHINFSCDGCKMHPIKGPRYHCNTCQNYDLCEKCYSSDVKKNHGHEFTLIKGQKEQTPKEKKEKKIERIHIGIKCNQCKISPIKGIRYKCSVCEDFDFCENCEKIYGKQHGHPMLRIPIENMVKSFKCTMKDDIKNIDDNEKIIFKGITCHKCKMKNIEGMLYKCAICKNYNLCENCIKEIEDKVAHKHPFIKLYHPNMKLESIKAVF